MKNALWREENRFTFDLTNKQEIVRMFLLVCLESLFYMHSVLYDVFGRQLKKGFLLSV